MMLMTRLTSPTPAVTTTVAPLAGNDKNNESSSSSSSCPSWSCDNRDDDDDKSQPRQQQQQLPQEQRHVYLPLSERDANCPAIPSLLQRCAAGEMASLQMGHLIQAKRHQPTKGNHQDKDPVGLLDLTISKFGEAKRLEALLDQLAPLSHLMASVTIDCWPWARNTHALLTPSLPPTSVSSNNMNGSNLTELNLWDCAALNDEQYQHLQERGLGQCASLKRLHLRVRLTGQEQQQELRTERQMTFCPKSRLQHVALGFYGTASRPTFDLLASLLQEQDELQSLSVMASLPLVLEERGLQNAVAETWADAKDAEMTSSPINSPPSLQFQKALARHESLRILTLQGHAWQLSTTALQRVLQAVATLNSLRRLDVSQTSGRGNNKAATDDFCASLCRHVPHFSSQLQQLWLPNDLDTSWSWKDLEQLGCALKQQQDNCIAVPQKMVQGKPTSGATAAASGFSQLQSIAITTPWDRIPPLLAQTLVTNVQCTVTAIGGSKDNNAAVTAAKLWPHVWAQHSSSPTALFAFLRTTNIGQ